MAALFEIRTALVATIAAVPQIGTVHDRERFAKAAADLVALYAGPVEGEIRGWYVRRTASRRISPNIGRTNVWHRWHIRGFVSFVDASASEHMMDGLVEAIVGAIGPDHTLGGLIAGSVTQLGGSIAGGVQVDDVGPAMLANTVLVHAADLSLITWHTE